MIPKSDDIRMEVSTLCSYSCGVCPHRKMKRPKMVMETKDFQDYLSKILDATDQYEHITFSGMGEPLFDPHLMDKVKIAKDRGLEVTIVTNGYALTPEVYQEMCDAEVMAVRVSITGMVHYGKSHGCEDRQLFILTETLGAMMERNGLTKVCVNCVAENEAEYELALSVFECQVHQLEIWTPHNWGDAFKHRKIGKKRKNCGRIFNGPLQVQVDGSVNVCCFDYNGLTTMGTLKTQHLHEIFAGAEFIRQVVCSNSGDWSGPLKYPCRKCDQRNEDRDGILLYTSRKDKDRIKRTSTTFHEIDTDVVE